MTKHILVADDEPSLRSMLRIFFTRLGYRVTLAQDGQEAVDLARQEPPDLALLDIQMPKLTGVDVVKLLRSDTRFASVPIIAITAHIRDYTQETVLDAGFDELLTKPFELPALRELVRSYLHEEGE